MPSKPKGKSEYNTNFKWLESFRGKDFKPAPEQLAPPAGQDSIFSKSSEEPALQRKKRVEGPPTSLSVNFDDAKYGAYDDFALLGKQQKFASNVRYGLRPGKPSKMADKAKDLNNNFSASVPPPPKQMKMAGKKSQAQKKLDVSDTIISKKESSKENLTPTTPPPAPRLSKSRDQPMVKEGLKDKNLSDILAKPKKAAKNDMNEAVQTDMDKGIALSNQEAPADYSLKYKAGIAPARVTKKASEYQKAFDWKKGFPASPLLSAEQIVYNSNSQVSPIKKSLMPKTTEYQAQFKTYKFPESVPPAPKASEEPNRRGRSKTQMKRSKSVGAGFSPDRMVPAGSAPVTFADDPRLLRQSCDNTPVPKVPVPHGKLRHVASEYRSNFKAPGKFSYDSGAWQDAYPPQLLQSKNSEREKKTEEKVEEKEPLSNWFAEVLELRRRANEYKRRAQGTHFSREHLLQLLAKQTGFWAEDSERSSNVASLDALALEPAKPPAGRPSFSKSEAAQKKSVDTVSMLAVRGDSPEPTEVNSCVSKEVKPTTKKGRGGKKSKSAWTEGKVSDTEKCMQTEEEPLDSNQNAACEVQSMEEVDEMEVEEVEDQGRLSTPVLRQQQERVQRHHLDRTTPSVGGILLSVPSQEVSSARSDFTEETVTDSQSSPKLKPVYTTEKLHTSPLLGKPTPDTHALRDDSASEDQVLEMHYIASPQRALAKADRTLKNMQRKLNNKIPPTIDERMGQTYNKDVGNFHVEDLPLAKSEEKDDDVLSLSAMSIASSSSLASEVYERARRRRDQFWGKPSQ